MRCATCSHNRGRQHVRGVSHIPSDPASCDARIWRHQSVTYNRDNCRDASARTGSCNLSFLLRRFLGRLSHSLVIKLDRRLPILKHISGALTLFAINGAPINRRHLSSFVSLPSRLAEPHPPLLDGTHQTDAHAQALISSHECARSQD